MPISTGQEVGQGIEQAGAVVGAFNPIAGAVVELVGQIASLFGNTHPAGHDVFIGIPANGGPWFNDNESNNKTDATTLGIQADFIQIMNEILANWEAQGAVLTNPILSIELRDDGSPIMLFGPPYVFEMSDAQKAQYNLPEGVYLGGGYSDRNPATYTSLGPPNNAQSMVQGYYNYLVKNGWISVPVSAPVGATPGTPALLPPPSPTFGVNTITSPPALQSAVSMAGEGAISTPPDPTQPTSVLSSQGTSVTVPALLGENVAGVPVWLLLGFGLLFLLRK